MGRTKTYDAEDIARKAMELFWRKGYHATSTQDLVDHMDVNRFSLYAEFGSKQGLFEAALSLYSREVVSSAYTALENKDASLAEIDALFAHVGSLASKPGSELGCFMCNTATERAVTDQSSHDIVSTHIDRVCKAFSKALDRSKRQGEIPADVKTSDEGRFLATTMFGLAVLFRSKVEPKVINAAVRSARRYISELATKPR